MIRLKKISIILTSVALMVTFCNLPAFAAERTENVKELPVSSISSSSKGTAPLTQSGTLKSGQEVTVQTSVPGDVGCATILWVNRGQILWALTANHGGDYITFVGEINIVDVNTNQVVRTLWVSGADKGYVERQEYFSGLTSGHDYRATLSGTGTCGLLPFVVGYGCSDTYYVR